jgi:general stress protein 26
MKHKIKALLESLPFIELNTVNEDGYPETRAMINLRNIQLCPHLKNKFRDDLVLYFTTNTFSSKIKQIAKNKKASVYLYNPETFEGVLLSGQVAEEADQKTKNGFSADSWEMYSPDGKDGGDYSILKFTTAKYKYYDGKFNKKEGRV